MLDHQQRRRSGVPHRGNVRGHHREVCGLKWSELGYQLASRGDDNLVHIWDRRKSMKAPTLWLHRLEEHTAAVKALTWSPFQANFLATGRGNGDGCIKFWNMHSGAFLNSVDTGSQVCSLLWNKNERELLSSHGYTDNQISLWKYPSMVKIAELKEHTSRVLFMAQSPDGCTVASAGDESRQFWNVFGDQRQVQNHLLTSTALGDYSIWLVGSYSSVKLVVKFR